MYWLVTKPEGYVRGSVKKPSSHPAQAQYVEAGKWEQAC